MSSEALRQDTSNADDVDSQRHRRLAASDYASEIVTLVRACSETSHRPGGAETISPRRRWQFDSRRIYVRPRTGPQSAHLWWPAVAKLAGSQRACSLGQLLA